MKRIASEFEKAEKALDSVAVETRAAALHIEANQAANAILSEASNVFHDGSCRIADALSSIAEDGTKLRASEARLLFENARLKRSSKTLRASLETLREAGNRLNVRAREAHAIAVAAERTQTLIDRINGCVERGEPVGHLLEAGQALAEEFHGRQAAQELLTRQLET